MPSSTIGAVPEADAAQAATFFRDWFGDERKLTAVVSLINPDKRAAEAARTKHLHDSPAGFRELFEQRPLDELIYMSDARWNVYQGVGLLAKPPGRNRKGGKKDIVRVPGIWVDLDVGKDGVFRDEEHALSLLRGVVPYATIVVATGTGGVHAYWKVAGGLSGQDAEELTTMWWAHLVAAGGVKIDKLVNCDRVMKTPGTIRWEKDPGDRPSLVRIIYSSDKTVPAGELARVAEPAYRDYRERIESRKRAVQRNRMDASRLAGSNLTAAGRWGPLLSASALEDEFNETHSWHEVLEPLGWTDLGTDGEGRTLWARPDQDRDAKYKSAATGYGGSHVMTLFSDSPVTGLWGLAEANIPLTKYRVWVETRFGGDEVAYARSVLGEGGV